MALDEPDEAVRILQGIESTYGVYACLGNHDGGSTLTDMEAFLARGNVTLLNDEYAVIENELVIIGRKDSSPIGDQGQPRKELTAVIKGLDVNLPIIVMDHNPANYNEYGSDIDLILSGHTHRGQIFPINVMTYFMYDADYGYYRKDGNSPQLIVTSGAGVWGPPLRIGSNNEIVSIEILS